VIRNLNKQKVVAGISGGVDSAMCLKLLSEQGFDVTAVYIKMCRYKGNMNDDIKSARKVAKALGVKFDIIDAGYLFYKKIVSYYDRQIKMGNTPSPCVLCNPEVKIETLLEYADSAGAYYIATGHYARIRKKDSLFIMQKAVDKTRDQTYSLCFLSPKFLSRMILPLGEISKKEVMKMAQEIKDLAFLSQRRPSQDFCYLGEVDQISYCKKRFPQNKGEIVDKSGRIIGYHNGIYSFTIGQRKGIGLSGGPYYVINKDAEKNQIIVSKNSHDLYKKKVILKPFNIIGTDITQGMNVMAKLRSTQKLTAAQLYKKDDSLILKFNVNQRAVTAGQVAVFYNDGICLGGGIISS